MKLPKKVKHKWLAALRSGKFVQGTGALKALIEDSKRKYGHCCLGVACSIGIAKKEDRESSMADNGYVSTEFLPKKTQNKLAAMNDGGKTFNQIAAWISRNL